MANLNKVQLIGRLGKNPETKTFSNGNKVVNFSLATSENWTDKNSGEKKEKTEWHNIAIFNEHLIKIAEKYLKKGSLCYLEGSIETRKWKDNDGNDRWTTEIVLKFDSKIQLLDSKSDQNSDGEEKSSSKAGGGGKSSSPNAKDLDDEIPFAFGCNIYTGAYDR